MKKKAYSSVAVNEVSLEPILKGRDGLALDVGCDIGKHRIFVMLRWGEGDFEKPWRVRNTCDLALLRDLLVQLNQGRRLRIGMEPTGTYGDPLRQLLADANLPVERVGTKATHDYAEVFDGVPSQHDGKDAAVIAELVALGKGRVWKFTAGSRWEQWVRYWVERFGTDGRELQMWSGRLEALLMRHWPELLDKQRLTSVTLLQMLVAYGTPRRLAADATAAERLRQWSFGKWSPQKIAKVIADANSSVGVRMGKCQRLLLRQYAKRALRAKRSVQRAQKELRRLGRRQPMLQAQAQVLGLPTACVLWVYLGDPRGYESAGAYRKAMGLNLKERSSGIYKGHLKISKRGQSVVRRLLYFAALRWSQREPVRSWHQAKKTTARSGRLAVVGIMRKLALALQPLAIQRGDFDVNRLFGKATAASRTAAQPGAKK